MLGLCCVAMNLRSVRMKSNLASFMWGCEQFVGIRCLHFSISESRLLCCLREGCMCIRT